MTVGTRHVPKLEELLQSYLCLKVRKKIKVIKVGKRIVSGVLTYLLFRNVHVSY